MSMASQSQSQFATAPVLATALHDIRYFANMLRGINFSNRATVIMHNGGLTVNVERARVILAKAYIPKHMFDEYKYMHPSEADDSEPGHSFELPLGTVLECLNIYGSGFASVSNGERTGKRNRSTQNDSGDDSDGRGRIEHYFKRTGGDAKTGMRMSYAGAGHPLEDANGPKTTCEITTLEPEEMLDLAFDDDRKVLQVIMKSYRLQAVLSDLASSCRDITFISTPPEESRPSKGRHAPPAQTAFRIRAEGTFGNSDFDYSGDKEVLELFECVEKIAFTYKFAHIHNCIQALKSSTRTSLRIDDEGLLSMQFMMPTSRVEKAFETNHAFVEFLCLPQEDREEVK
ncbi:Rad1-domain-containing protein [Auricularia subglabra TFB-10046 SS5]|nr:Rad1-domain-containing protein [Auricularia subglabra TFB-10046 SS5]